MSGSSKPANGKPAEKPPETPAAGTAPANDGASTAGAGTTGATPGEAGTPGPAPGPQASAEGNTTPGNPNPKPPEDKTEPKDLDAQHSVGGENPNQPTPAATAGGASPAADKQGNSSREAEEARRNGIDPAAATVGVTPAPVPLPSEGGGYAPIPHPDTGDADSDKVGYTQATQRLVHPDDMHEMPLAIGAIANIPSGSRPMMVDPQTGRGLVPPQIREHDEQAEILKA